jgi:uncharacterized repeat protein (TIGR02543 family)
MIIAGGTLAIPAPCNPISSFETKNVCHRAARLSGLMAVMGFLLLFTLCKAAGSSNYQGAAQVKLWNVKFDSGGGEPAPEAVAVVDGETIGDKFPADPPEKDDYSFDGWYLGDVQFDPRTPIIGDITLRANWIGAAEAGHYHVTFDGDGGSPAIYIERNVIDGGTVDPLPADPARTGYDFGGWYTEKNGGGSPFTPATPVVEAVAASPGVIIVYAEWTPITYTVNYDAKGGTGGTPDSTHTYSAATALTVNGFSRKNYAFSGWDSTDAGETAAYIDGQPLTTSALFPDNTTRTKTLYAVWAALPEFTAGPLISLAPGHEQLAWTITASDPEAESYNVYWVLGNETDAETVKEDEGATIAAGTTPAGKITGLAADTGYSVIVSAYKSGYADSDSAIVSETTYRVYAIGETGPAGGEIFYANPNFAADGWRYMEAALSDLSAAQWGGYGTSVSTGTAIGTGKQNTANIIAVLAALGETGKAAQLCAAYVYGGYNDWFLPSWYELCELWKARNSIGGFLTGNSDYYWSSSEFVSTYSRTSLFKNGMDYSHYKNLPNSVRAVRSF